MRDKKGKVLALVQARMGSTRLPGKHLLPLLEKPMLSRLFERLRRAKKLDLIALATTVEKRDDPLIELAVAEKIPFYRGSEENVLQRFHEAAKQFEAGTIVRITADCPLMDPACIDEMVDFFTRQPLDYANNLQTYPRGMDVEIFSTSSFEAVFREAVHPEEQEHVTPYYYRHPEMFRLGSLPKQAHPNYRLTVDTPEDFALIDKVFSALYPQNRDFTLADIYRILEQHPDWSLINAHIQQKSL